MWLRSDRIWWPPDQHRRATHRQQGCRWPVDGGASRLLAEATLAGFVNALSVFIEVLSGDNDPQNALGAGVSNSAGSAAFNNQHPQGQAHSACGQGAAVVNGVRYSPWAAPACSPTSSTPPMHCWAPAACSLAGEQNDGLVGKCSSHWGVVLRDNYPWNHLDRESIRSSACAVCSRPARPRCIAAMPID